MQPSTSMGFLVKKYLRQISLLWILLPVISNGIILLPCYFLDLFREDPSFVRLLLPILSMMMTTFVVYGSVKINSKYTNSGEGKYLSGLYSLPLSTPRLFAYINLLPLLGVGSITLFSCGAWSLYFTKPIPWETILLFAFIGYQLFTLIFSLILQTSKTSRTPEILLATSQTIVILLSRLIFPSVTEYPLVWMSIAVVLFVLNYGYFTCFRRHDSGNSLLRRIFTKPTFLDKSNNQRHLFKEKGRTTPTANLKSVLWQLSLMPYLILLFLACFVLYTPSLAGALVFIGGLIVTVWLFPYMHPPQKNKESLHFLPLSDFQLIGYHIRQHYLQILSFIVLCLVLAGTLILLPGMGLLKLAKGLSTETVSAAVRYLMDPITLLFCTFLFWIHFYKKAKPNLTLMTSSTSLIKGFYRFNSILITVLIGLFTLYKLDNIFVISKYYSLDVLKGILIVSTLYLMGSTFYVLRMFGRALSKMGLGLTPFIKYPLSVGSTLILVLLLPLRFGGPVPLFDLIISSLTSLLFILAVLLPAVSIPMDIYFKRHQ